MSLRFDPDSHLYRVDGIIVPSVTQVLEDVGIVDYSRLPGSTREMALRRGSAVHAACHYDDEGDLDETQLGGEGRTGQLGPAGGAAEGQSESGEKGLGRC